MKRHFCTFIICFIIGCEMHASAQVKPYMAIVNTGKEVFRGVLYDVAPDRIGVKKDTGVVFFNACDIKSIKLKAIKGRSKYGKYINYDPYNEKNYEKVSRKMVAVRKWGEKGPTMEEELSCRILTGFYTAAINGLSAPINLISGNLATFNVNYDEGKYKEGVPSLTFYSILYQRNPGANLEPEQSKVIASK